MQPLLVASAILLSLQSALAAADPACGYASCHPVQEGALNVHVIPHSHDDVGWLKTPDEYYLGQRNYIHNANVSAILNSVFEALQENPDRRFVQVETAYLWMWWRQQDARRRAAYRRLVEAGRLHVAGGGWTMSDEATTSYLAVIDNFSWGLRRLNDSLGPCGVPRVGWQIDSFGHSRQTAAILALMGYDGLVLNRIDYRDKLAREQARSMEFLWRAGDHQGAEQLFSTVLWDHYHPPPRCCWDPLCADPDIGDWNAEAVVESFLDYVKEQAQHFATNHVMVTMGNDFTYMDARRYYRNIDKLVQLVNGRREGVRAVYSTPDCYVKAVHDAAPPLDAHRGDFFPYASAEDQYWTGFYTSRPSLKYLERQAGGFLQVCKQLGALTGQGGGQLDALRETLGVLQHHDAITGTARRRVVAAYTGRLLAAARAASGAARRHLNRLLGAGRGARLELCPLLNESRCELSEAWSRDQQGGDLVVAVYNPLSRAVSQHVRLPVARPVACRVVGPDGRELPAQLLPVPRTMSAPGPRSGARYELVFRAQLPPLGLRAYRLQLTSGPAPAASRDTHIGHAGLRLELNASSGLASRLASGDSSAALRQELMYYRDLGGAYVFRPDRQAAPVALGAAYTVYKGEIVDEVHQVFSEWASQVIRIYKDEDYVEFEWLVGPLPMGTDVISRFSTDLRSGGQFRTDSNGREMMLRRRGRGRGSRPVAGNYYPVTSRIEVRDEATRQGLAVLVDRAQGGSSLRDGQLELMLHRRLLRDDGMGLGERLDDRRPARGRHLVLAGASGSRQRLLSQQLLLRPWLFLAPAGTWPPAHKHQFSGLRTPLPDSVQLLSLEPWREDSLLLRLEHIGDDELPSGEVTVDLKDLLSTVDVISVRETTLDGNQWLSDVHRLDWRGTGGRPGGRSCAASEPQGSFVVCLAPAQIRTFVLWVAHQQDSSAPPPHHS